MHPGGLRWNKGSISSRSYGRSIFRVAELGASLLAAAGNRYQSPPAPQH
jgi:hypothetical protein